MVSFVNAIGVHPLHPLLRIAFSLCAQEIGLHGALSLNVDVAALLEAEAITQNW